MEAVSALPSAQPAEAAAPRRRAQERAALTPTEIQYARKYNQVKARARKALGQSFSPATFVAYIIGEVRARLNPASWYWYRRALVCGLEREAQAAPGDKASITAALRQLRQVQPAERPPEAKALKTAQQKSTRFVGDDAALICERAKRARTANGPILADWLLAGEATGLRPVEWLDAQLTALRDGEFRWRLRVRNAKRNAARAHGEFRTLRWRALDAQTLGAINRTIEVARAAVRERRFTRLQNTLQALMRRITKKLFPRRRRRPTMYTPRHVFAARCKAFFIPPRASLSERAAGLAKIAALLGHASDATATDHYARPGKEDRTGHPPVPTPDPAEVARVKCVYAARFARLLDRQSHAPQP
jgi:hypothetical protein